MSQLLLPTLEEFKDNDIFKATFVLPRPIFLVFNWAYLATRYREDAGIAIDWAVVYDNACKISRILEKNNEN